MERALIRAYFGDSNHPDSGGEGEILLVVSSDMGLAGAFNAEIMKAAEREVAKSNVIHIVTVGIKAESHFRRPRPITLSVILSIHPDLTGAIIVDDIEKSWIARTLPAENGFQQFKNPLAQYRRPPSFFPLRF
jgi:F-type H+-transporting ATPase subunit gamma